MVIADSVELKRSVRGLSFTFEFRVGRVCETFEGVRAYANPWYEYRF